ncbi:MAG TPA: dihydroneopterin aldolase [Caulobacteraceae bacterium]|nr:dihydroneopterin aldolase [Caulobacteraceae bacterium]
MNSPSLPLGAVRVASARVFVRGLTIEAEIGVYDHEHGRRQPLVIDAELELVPRPIEHIADTFNYETFAEVAGAVVALGHVKLVETFAERLAAALLGDPRVISARVRVEKPEALAPAVAGVEVVVSRA